MNRLKEQDRCDRSGLRNGRGLTLVECMIATVILAAGAGATMAALSASYQQRRYAGEEMVAARLAEELLERVSAHNFVVTADRQELDGLVEYVSETGEVLPEGTETAYVRTVTVQPTPASGLTAPAGMGIAQVEVTSPSGSKMKLTRLLRTDG